MTGRARKILPAAAALAAAPLLLAACGSSGKAASLQGGGGAGRTAASSAASLVAVHTVAGVGSVLTDSTGRVLYSPSQESGGALKCTGSCLTVWPPLLLPAGGAVPASVPGASGTFGTVARPGGGSQLTYDGSPLYRFSFDKAADQAGGNGVHDSFGGVAFDWHAVSASGGPASAAPSSSGSGAGSGGGYGGY